MIAAAAALIVALAIAVPLLLSGGQDAGPIADTTPATVPPASTTVTTIPSVIMPTPVDPLSWRRIYDGDLDTAGIVNTLTSTSHGFVAGGSAGDLDGAGTAALWLSDNGSDWLRVESDALGAATSPFGDDGATEIRGVVSHTGRIVAVGVDTPRNPSVGGQAAAIWYSRDGETWSRVDHDDALFGAASGSQINAVVVPFNAGFVAVGSDVWASPDGIVWERREFDRGTAHTVIQTDSGLLAGGTTGLGDVTNPTGDAAVWMSADLGTQWTEMNVDTAPELFDRSIITALTQTDDGFIAVGAVGRGLEGSRPAVWSSPDGAAWNLTWVGEPTADGILRDVSVSATRVLAVGEQTDASAAGNVWHSADSGATWVQDPDERDTFRPRSEDGSVSVRATLTVSADGDAFLTAGHRDGTVAIWAGSNPERVSLPPEAEPEETIGWTCQARIDNGAAWVPAEWVEDDGSYVVHGTPACVDVLDIHMDPRHWKVEWEGEIDVVEVGFQFVFEKGIHGTQYEKKEVDTKSGVWITQELEPDRENPFTFVAMPHSFDEWDSITFTITPCDTPYCS